MSDAISVIATELAADMGHTPDIYEGLAIDIADALANAGFVIVPENPTGEMIEAGSKARGFNGQLAENTVNTYRAMIETGAANKCELMCREQNVTERHEIP